MLQNARVTAFTVSELLLPPLPPPKKKCQGYSFYGFWVTCLNVDLTREFFEEIKVLIHTWKLILEKCSLKSDSHLSKKIVSFEKLFSFTRYLSFCHDFWSYKKNGLTRKIKLTSKFMTSQPGLQRIAIHILPNISQSKSNQTMNFDQLIEYNKRNVFLQKLCGKWSRETSSQALFIFLKSLIWGESKWSAA